MDRAEYEALVAAQRQYLARIGPDTRFTADILCAMHLAWLGDLYSWAGEYRTVEVWKDGFSWPPARMVRENMAKFETDVRARHTPCRPGPLDDVATRLAEVHAELLLVHPFREGNGRFSRWLAGLMALQAGLPTPDYRFRGKGGPARRKRYLAAVVRGYARDYRPLAGFLAEMVGCRLRDGD
jgi:cell filamentation protein